MGVLDLIHLIGRRRGEYPLVQDAVKNVKRNELKEEKEVEMYNVLTKIQKKELEERQLVIKQACKAQ